MLAVGFDFDGVIVYNPLHVARAPIAWFKRKFLGLSKTSFYKPRSKWQFFVWKILFFLEIPARSGLNEIARLKKEGKIRPILLTGRYHLKKPKLLKFLKKIGYADLFDEVIVNEKNEQPHEFKARVIREKKMDVYVEDNVDIVLYLNSLNSLTSPNSPNSLSCRIIWLYNIVDRRFDYPLKFPHLKDAVKAICP